MKQPQNHRKEVEKQGISVLTLQLKKIKGHLKNEHL